MTVTQPQWRGSNEPRHRQDPERTRRLILAAASEEFSRHGYDRARVVRIAEAACVRRQLITDHFGGKKGLYDALTEHRLDRNADLASGPEPFVRLIQEHVSWVHEDESWARTLAREALDGSFPVSDERVTRLIELVARLRLRQHRGGISDQFDVGALSLVLLAACTAPAILPTFAHSFVGLDPSSVAFRDLYAEQLARTGVALGRPEPAPGPAPVQPAGAATRRPGEPCSTESRRHDHHRPARLTGSTPARRTKGINDDQVLVVRVLPRGARPGGSRRPRRGARPDPLLPGSVGGGRGARL